MTINVDGLLYGGMPKNINQEMVSLDIPTPVIPGGDVGDEGGVVQLMRYVTDPIDDANIMEERDEDQRLSKEEYDVYTYPDQSVSEICFKIDLAAIPNYAPQMDDNVYIIIDGNIVANLMVAHDDDTSISIPILGTSEMYSNSFALSAEELQLEERFVADMEIVIGQLSENTIVDDDGVIGSNYSFDSVFARTAPDAPVSLALEGPGTLDGQIGDGASF